MLKIRTPAQEEWPRLIQVAQAARETLSHRSAFNWEPSTLQEEFSQVFTLMAERASQPAGFICYRELPEAFEVSVLATSPQHQRQGVQTELIKYLQELAALHQKQIWLEVHEQNTAAAALYEKMGFQRLRMRRNYYSDGAGALVLGWTGA